MKKIKGKTENKKSIYIAFISSFILLLFAYKFYISELPNKNNITKIRGILKENIKIKKGRRGSKTLIIKLQEYPKINFTIGNVSLRQTHEQKLLEENKLGDSITFFIENKEYKRKILKTEEIPFPENYLHPETISVVEINNNNSNYLSLTDYNKEHKENNYLGIAFFSLFGLFMAFLGIKGIEYHKKNFR
jgi:hypothetical protein